MQAELERVVQDADLGLRWELAGERPSAVNGRLVSVSLQGRCLAARPEAYERGPLGWTKTANGRVLPYVEIDCGRLQALLEPAWEREPDVVQEMQFGKALGRVLAHELAHALARSHHHSAEGLRKPALSPRDLTTGSYQLARSDFEQAAHQVELARSLRPEAPGKAAEEPAEISDGGR
jgi:hypothetical protein